MSVVDPDEFILRCRKKEKYEWKSVYWVSALIYYTMEPNLFFYRIFEKFLSRQFERCPMSSWYEYRVIRGKEIVKKYQGRLRNV